MKINKRECRKFADPELKMNQNHGKENRVAGVSAFDDML